MHPAHPKDDSKVNDVSQFSINVSPVLRRAHTIFSAIPKQAVVVNLDSCEKADCPPQRISPLKRVSSPATNPRQYEATSRWNDMVQDDEIERLQRSNLPRLAKGQGSKACTDQKE